MKKYRVYSSDTGRVVKSFDSIEDAKRFCRRGFGIWSRYIIDNETGRYLYKAWKNNDGKIIEKTY